MNSTDFLNYAVGAFFAVFVIFAVIMILRLIAVLEELRGVLTETKQTAKNANEATERVKNIAVRVEETMEAINPATVGAVAGFVKGLVFSKRKGRKK